MVRIFDQKWFVFGLYGIYHVNKTHASAIWETTMYWICKTYSSNEPLTIDVVSTCWRRACLKNVPTLSTDTGDRAAQPWTWTITWCMMSSWVSCNDNDKTFRCRPSEPTQVRVPKQISLEKPKETYPGSDNSSRILLFSSLTWISPHAHVMTPEGVPLNSKKKKRKTKTRQSLVQQLLNLHEKKGM